METPSLAATFEDIDEPRWERERATDTPQQPLSSARRSRKDRLISCFGWTIDLFTVSLSIVDVASDVLVALQFLRDGHVLWAWLVFGCFLNCSVIYSVIITQTVFHDSRNDFGYYELLCGPLQKLAKPVAFLLVLPFAQLAPTINYLAQTFFIRPKKRFEEGSWSSEPIMVGINVDANAPRVVREEHAAIKDSADTMSRLQAALNQQFYTHGMLIVETVVESIPQSIIQLLAITFLGSPSNLQVASTVLSILSVVSKGYFVSVSCDLHVSAAKFLVVSHDVFSLFYLFCSVVSRHGPHDVAIFGSNLRVSYITFVWMIKVIAIASAIAITLILLGIVSIVLHFCSESARDRLSMWKVWFGIRLALVFIFFFVPGLLALEGAKLSWALVILKRHEPASEMIPTAAMLFAFLKGKRPAESGGRHMEVEHQSQPQLLPVEVGERVPPGLQVPLEEWKRRLAFLHAKAYTYLLTRNAEDLKNLRFGVSHKVPLDRTARLRWHLDGSMKRVLENARRAVAKRTRHIRSVADSAEDALSWLDSCQTEEDIDRDPLLSEEEKKRLMRRYFFVASDIEDSCSTRKELLTLNADLVHRVEERRHALARTELTPSWQSTLLSDFIIDVVYDHKRLRSLHLKDEPLLVAWVDDNDLFSKVLNFSIRILCSLNSVAIVMSFAFPFVNYAMYFETQNLLQHVCFGLLASSLATLVLLLPSVRLYVRFCSEYRASFAFVTRHYYTYDPMANVAAVKELSKHIADYHLPSFACVLREAVPPALLPPDVLDLAAAFLPDGAIDLRQLSLSECTAHAERNLH